MSGASDLWRENVSCGRHLLLCQIVGSEFRSVFFGLADFLRFMYRVIHKSVPHFVSS